MAAGDAWKVTLKVDRLLRLQTSIQTRATDQVRDKANFCREYAYALSPVRTGALKESWYVSGPNDESDYAVRASDAQSLNPEAIITIELKAAFVDPNLGQLRSPETGQFSLPEAIVASCVNYSLYLEYGTRYMSAQPILFPASEATREQFIEGMLTVADDA